MHCWEVIGTSPSMLKRGHVVYTEQYGLVKLKEVLEHEKHGWKVFLCMDKEEEVVTEIIVRWDSQKVPDDESATDNIGQYGLISFLFSPF
jgi:hypothetical protein